MFARLTPERELGLRTESLLAFGFVGSVLPHFLACFTLKKLAP